MEQENSARMLVFAQNLVNVCIDNYREGEMGGRIYHCFEKDPLVFRNIMQMIEQMEYFYDEIAFPQASTKIRSFVRESESRRHQIQKKADYDTVASYRGGVGTFLVYVQYRQNSTWQGEVDWIEGKAERTFVSELELLKLINNSLG